MRGVIARIVVDGDTGKRKGFGFIKGEDGEDYFFHASGLQQTTKRFADVQEMEGAEFTPIDGPKGPRAIEVRIVGA